VSDMEHVAGTYIAGGDKKMECWKQLGSFLWSEAGP
jgi:hypothetical protein